MNLSMNAAIPALSSYYLYFIRFLDILYSFYSYILLLSIRWLSQCFTHAQDTSKNKDEATRAKLNTETFFYPICDCN